MPTLQIKAVKCGKLNCNRCPHGFYLYAYWKENGRTKSKYIGSLGKDNKELYEKIRDMGEWKQWREVFKKHKESWGKSFGKDKSEGKKDFKGQPEHEREQKRSENDVVRKIEELLNNYWNRLSFRDRDKINKLITLIKDKAVHAGEKASAISAIERILKRQAI